MANGITISQQGINVDDALDSQKVLDTRWRYFEIYKEIEISVPNIVNFTSPTIALYTHNLGFVPFFEIYNITTGGYIAPFSGSGGPGVKDWSITGGIVSDKNSIFRFGLYQTTDGYSDCRLLIRIYNVDATQEYTAPLVVANPYQAGKKAKYGVKVTQKQDPDMMRNQELSNFTLNTEGKSLAIQKIGVIAADTNTGFVAKIDHNMGNLPIYLTAYMKLDKSMVSALNPDFVPVRATADRKYLTFSGVQAALIANFTYIIFKELAETAI